MPPIANRSSARAPLLLVGVAEQPPSSAGGVVVVPPLLLLLPAEPVSEVSVTVPPELDPPLLAPVSSSLAPASTWPPPMHLPLLQTAPPVQAPHGLPQPSSPHSLPSHLGTQSVPPQVIA